MISSKTNRNIFRFNTFRNTQDESNHSFHDNHMEGVNGPAFMLPSGKPTAHRRDRDPAFASGSGEAARLHSIATSGMDSSTR